MKLSMLTTAPFAVLALAACSSGGPSTGSSSSTGNLTETQYQTVAFSQNVTPGLIAALQAAGIAGYLQPEITNYAPDSRLYFATVSCDSETSCTLLDNTPADPTSINAGPQVGDPISVDGSTASTIYDDLIGAGVTASQISGVTLRCEYIDYTNGTTSNYCSAGVSTQTSDPVTQFTTGNNALVSWSAGQSTMSSNGETYSYGTTYEFKYEDLYDYFNGAPEIQATVVLRTHTAHHGGGNDPEQTSATDYALKQVRPNVYQGTFVLSTGGAEGDTETDIDSEQVAFHNGDQWDSNNGANYSF